MPTWEKPRDEAALGNPFHEAGTTSGRDTSDNIPLDAETLAGRPSQGMGRIILHRDQELAQAGDWVSRSSIGRTGLD